MQDPNQVNPHTTQPSPSELVDWPLTPADAKRVQHVLEFYDAQTISNTAPIRDLIATLQAALDAVPM